MVPPPGQPADRPPRRQPLHNLVKRKLEVHRGRVNERHGAGHGHVRLAKRRAELGRLGIYFWNLIRLRHRGPPVVARPWVPEVLHVRQCAATDPACPAKHGEVGERRREHSRRDERDGYSRGRDDD